MDKENSHGVVGNTLLSNLKYFKPTECTNIDYMHSILEGVLKRFFKFWFDETVRETDQFNFSLKPHMNEIDKRLLNIKVPSFIPATPRSIRDYKMWRVKEFLIFLIYFMLPIFYDLMDSIFLINITKLVVAIEYLLSREILKSDLIYVQNILNDFVLEVEQIYPPNIMLSGIHEILHIVECTIKLGPMNCVCCFQYEEVNRKIVNLIHSKDLIGTEFLQNFSVLQSLEAFCDSSSNNTKFNEFIKKHNIIKTSNKKRVNKEKCILGPLINATVDQIKVISEYLDINEIDRSNIKSCNRITIDGVLYTTTKNLSKRADFCVFIDPIYGLINDFIKISNKIYVLVDHLLSPFYDINYPEIQSKTFTNFFVM